MATRPTTTSDISEGQVETRILKGALVNFGPGANVLSMKHPSDYSAIQISCSMPLRTAANFATCMFGLFREPVGLPRIHVITGPDACPDVAHVQVKDPSFATRIKAKFDRHSRFVRRTKIAIKEVAVDIHYEASDNTPDVTAITRDLLQDRLATLRIEKDPTVSECAVCLTEAEDPYVTACGHLYCRSCLSSQCHSVGKGDIPIRCLGDAGECLRIFPLPELKPVLQSDLFEQLLDQSFALHVQTIDTIQECPTAHCRQTYRTSTDGSVLTCVECSTPTCTTCQAPSHSGVTCATYRRVGTADFETWSSSNKGIRKCPRCRNLIEKTAGCDRVKCRCGAGLCWRCMELWDENRQCRCRRAVWGSGAGKDGLLSDESYEKGGNAG